MIRLPSPSVWIVSVTASAEYGAPLTTGPPKLNSLWMNANWLGGAGSRRLKVSGAWSADGFGSCCLSLLCAMAAALFIIIENAQSIAVNNCFLFLISSSPYRLIDQPDCARQPVIAEQHIGLDRFIRAFLIEWNPQRNEVGTRHPDADDPPALQRNQIGALYNREKLRDEFTRGNIVCRRAIGGSHRQSLLALL